MSAAVAACAGRLHIEIKESGPYALDYDAIVAAQPALKDCRADDIYLLNRGKEVPLRIGANADGTFGSGQRIVWLGEALHGPQSWYDQYSSVNVYQLGVSAGSHARLREVAAAASPATASLQRTLHFEQENLMLRVSDAEMKPGDEPDVWQWAKLTPIDPKPFTYDFDLPDFDAAATKRPIAMTFDFRGMSNVPAKAGLAKPVDHVVEITINGKTLAPVTWDGRNDFRAPIDVPAATLKEKGNSLAIRVVKRDLANDATTFIVDVAMFNWFDARYPLRNPVLDHASAFGAVQDGVARIGGADSFDVLGSDGTRQHVGAQNRMLTLQHDAHYFAATAEQYRAPLEMRAVENENLRDSDGFDYLVVAHPRLIDAIQPLAQFHREQGLKVAVYNVEDIYDAFNGGLVHPSAIRDLVAWGSEHWHTKPRYLLLVGDASFDIHHDQRRNSSSASQYAIRTGLLRDELLAQGGLSAMATTRYAEWDQQLPNRNLIPAWQSPTPEGQSASDNPYVAIKPGDFHPQVAVGRFPVVAPADVKTIVDKTIAYLSHPTSGDWRRDVTLVSTSEVPSFKGESDKISRELEQRGFAVNNVYSDFNEKDARKYQAVRTTLRDDLDPGNLLVHFIGHGGQFIWRVGPIGDLFTLDDVSALKNVGRYPMVLAMTCFSAPFDHPTEDSIGERFLRESGKGAIAVFAASWSNWPNPENSSALIRALLKPGATIGDAIVDVKQKTSDRTLVEMYNLLGDPAIVLAQPKGTLRFARGAGRWNRQLAVRIDSVEFGGNVDVDWLDAHGAVIASKKYESRDAQFSLPVPSGAASVSVFAEDLRRGWSAFGSFNLLEPAAEDPQKLVARIAAATASPVRRGPHVRSADEIAFRDFEIGDRAAPGAIVATPH